MASTPLIFIQAKNDGHIYAIQLRGRALPIGLRNVLVTNEHGTQTELAWKYFVQLIGGYNVAR